MKTKIPANPQQFSPTPPSALPKPTGRSSGDLFKIDLEPTNNLLKPFVDFAEKGYDAFDVASEICATIGRHDHAIVAPDWKERVRHYINATTDDLFDAAADIGKSLHLDTPSHGQYERFTELYLKRVELLYREISTETNTVKCQVLTPPIRDESQQTQRRWVVHTSPCKEIVIRGKAKVRFRPMPHNNIELSCIIVEKRLRGQGIGKRLLSLCTEITRSIGGRLLLYPSPPGEVRDEISNQSRYVRELRRYYSKRRFTSIHPEMVEMETMQGARKLFGICDLMAFR